MYRRQILKSFSYDYDINSLSEFERQNVFSFSDRFVDQMIRSNLIKGRFYYFLQNGTQITCNWSVEQDHSHDYNTHQSVNQFSKS